MEIFLILWFVLFFFIIGKSIHQWVENENSPVLTQPATIVDMRRKTHHHHHNGHHHHSYSYHVTFQKDDGQQNALKVKRSEYHEMAIGDKGTLTHQGTRYQGFERTYHAEEEEL